jgi:hypothetical protein
VITPGGRIELIEFKKIPKELLNDSIKEESSMQDLLDTRKKDKSKSRILISEQLFYNNT